MRAGWQFRVGRRPHPLARLGFAALAVSLLVVASAFVLLLAAGVLLVWLARRGWQRLGRGAVPPVAAPSNSPLEGEFRVIEDPQRRLLTR